MNKNELRKKYLTIRKQFTAQEIQFLSQQIATLFFEKIDLSLIKTVHIFLPIHKNNELDTWQFISIFREKYPHIQLLIPKTDFQKHTMEHYIFDENTPLEENKYGILEPITGEKINPMTIDLVITPLLIVDKKGYRVGYGGGFYDRFFAECRENVQKIGVCFHETIEKISDINEYDAPLTHCISPTQCYSFF